MAAPRQSLRPFATVALVAGVSSLALSLAIAQGWLGPDIGRGANFCEAARHGWVKQPANTYSNAAFVGAALLIGWHLRRGDALGVMRRFDALWLACVIALLGPGSAAMHATQSACGGHLDMLSMYLVASFAAAYGWVRWAGRGRTAFGLAFVIGVFGCEVIASVWTSRVPVVVFSGNLAFAALLISAAVFEVLIWRRASTARVAAYGFAAVACMALAFTIWNLGQHGWCDPQSPLQAHAIWHGLCAVAAYLLFRLYASERPR